MKSRSRASLALLTACALAAVHAPAAQSQQTVLEFKMWEPPRTVPDLAFTDNEGQERLLSDFRGRTVLLNVWATWCPPCRKEMPALDRLQIVLGGPQFEVIALSIDARGLRDVQPFYENLKLSNIGIFIDNQGSAMRDLRIIGLPTTLLINDQGQELGRRQGPAEWDSVEVLTLLRERIAASRLKTDMPR